MRNKQWHSLLIKIVECYCTTFKLYLGTSEREADCAKHKIRSKSEEKVTLATSTLLLAAKNWEHHWYPPHCYSASVTLLPSAWRSTGMLEGPSKCKRQRVIINNFSCMTVLGVLLVMQLFCVNLIYQYQHYYNWTNNFLLYFDDIVRF